MDSVARRFTVNMLTHVNHNKINYFTTLIYEDFSTEIFFTSSNRVCTHLVLSRIKCQHMCLCVGGGGVGGRKAALFLFYSFLMEVLLWLLNRQSDLLFTFPSQYIYYHIHVLWCLQSRQKPINKITANSH